MFPPKQKYIGGKTKKDGEIIYNQAFIQTSVKIDRRAKSQFWNPHLELHPRRLGSPSISARWWSHFDQVMTDYSFLVSLVILRGPEAHQQVVRGWTGNNKPKLCKDLGRSPDKTKFQKQKP
jgi:hypothetical protein